MTRSRNIRKKAESRIVRTNPIEQHYTDCLKCGHIHNIQILDRYYEKQGKKSMHFLCDKCNYRMRLSKTTFGFLVFNKQSCNGYTKKQWEDVFQAAKVQIPDDVKTWLTRTYEPPRRREAVK